MELYADYLHFPGITKWGRRRKVCLLGGVFLRVGTEILSIPEENTERCLPAVTIRFLRTLFNNHFAGTLQPLLPSEPCRLLPSEDGLSVHPDGLPFGVDLDVIHEDGYVLLRGVGIRTRIPYGQYREAVIGLARQVRDVYVSAPPRRPQGELNQRGYRAFMRELVDLLERAKSMFHRKAPRIQAPDFRDPISYSDRQIKEITAAGVETVDRHLTSFRESAYFFYRMNGGNGRVIGERHFVGGHPCARLYTYPRVTEIYFLPPRAPSLKPLPSCEERFEGFEARLLEAGFSLADVELE